MTVTKFGGEVGSECYICGGRDCVRLDCSQHLKEIDDELATQARIMFRKAIFAALRDRCKPSQLPRVVRWFYVFKFLVAVALRRHATDLIGDGVEVGQHHYASLHAGWEASWSEVGRGLRWSSWRYELINDSDWNM